MDEVGFGDRTLGTREAFTALTTVVVAWWKTSLPRSAASSELGLLLAIGAGSG
jgi:hypothetical protein